MSFFSRVNPSKSTEYGDSIVFDSRVKFDIDYSMDNNHSSLPKLVELTDSGEPVEMSSQSEYCEASEVLRNRHSNSRSDEKNGKILPKHSCTSQFFLSEFTDDTSHCGQAWDDVEHIDTFWDKPRRIRRSISCDCVLCKEKFSDNSRNKQLVLGHHNYSEDNIHSKVSVFRHLLINIFLEILCLNVFHKDAMCQGRRL